MTNNEFQALVHLLQRCPMTPAEGRFVNDLLERLRPTEPVEPTPPAPASADASR